MSSIATVNGLRIKIFFAAIIGMAPLAIVATLALAAQDKYSLQIPNGLPWSDFRGYEDWANVASSQTATEIKTIVANSIMMDAFRSGLPSGGKLFPDGSKVAKIEWSFKKNAVSPYFVTVPDALKTVAFIEKDTKRFPNTHGWAYASWDYDAATDTFKPASLNPSGAECGYACHTIVASQDYIFTAYPKR
jgi:hypothetical protein